MRNLSQSTMQSEIISVVTTSKKNNVVEMLASRDSYVKKIDVTCVDPLR